MLVGLTVITADVAPVFHKYVPPPLAVNVAVAPVHIVPSLFATPEVSVISIAAIGNGFTTNDLEVDDEHPETVIVTVYVPAIPVVIAAVVAPVLQTYVPPPLAVKVADAPAHRIPSLLATPDVSVTVITGTGNGLTDMTVSALEIQLFAFVTVTV